MSSPNPGERGTSILASLLVIIVELSLTTIDECYRGRYMCTRQMYYRTWNPTLEQFIVREPLVLSKVDKSRPGCGYSSKQNTARSTLRFWVRVRLQNSDELSSHAEPGDCSWKGGHKSSLVSVSEFAVIVRFTVRF